MKHLPSFSFGDLLKASRKRKRLTQQALANRIGVHCNTIGIWERGNYLPESKTIVLEIAHQLMLDQQETRYLLEASLTALTPYWSVPLLRNPFFVGRDKILERLRSMSHDEAQMYSLHGLGGIGKTQVALEYAYRYAMHYTAVFWIGAETAESIRAGFLQIAEQLMLPERREADQTEVIAAVQHWLSRHQGWLMIWDNVEDLELLTSFLSVARQGVMLLTTRLQSLGTLALTLEIPSLTQDEGVLLLFHRARLLELNTPQSEIEKLQSISPTEYTIARELVTLADGLPLALDQMGAYMEETPCSLTDYFQLYQTRSGELLRRRGKSMAYPASVATTWSLSLEKMEQGSRAAVDLLKICAFLAPDAIPEEIFSQGAAFLGERLGIIAQDPLCLNEIFSILYNYSLMRRDIREHTISIHRLVQAVLREGMSEQERVVVQWRVVSLLNALFPEETEMPTSWKQCERLLPHVITCETTVSDAVRSQELAEVLQKSAEYLCERAQYERSELLYQQALYIQKQVLGLKHPRVARSLYGLAFLYGRQGKYDQAEPLYQQSLRIREQSLGLNHPEVAQSFYGLATLFYRQGKYAQAELSGQRALSIWKQVVEPDQLQMAKVLNILAITYRIQKKYEQAITLGLQALNIRRQILEPDHPHVATSLETLADIYREQENYAQAEEAYQRALHIHEQIKGPDHPDVAHGLNGLAIVYSEQKKFEQAEILYQRALHIWEQTFGLEHPLIAYVLNNLAEAYMEQGKYTQVEPLYQRALHIWTQQHGSDHPEMATFLDGLATFYLAMSKYDEAESLYLQALTIQEQHLSPHDPDRARSLLKLARLYEKRERHEQAESLRQEACSVFEQSLGKEHPETVKARSDSTRFLERK